MSIRYFFLGEFPFKRLEENETRGGVQQCQFRHFFNYATAIHVGNTHFVV